MTTVTTPTKGLWRLSESKGGSLFVYAEGENQPLLPRIKLPKRATKQMRANAELIVRAVNDYKLAHDVE